MPVAPDAKLARSTELLLAFDYGQRRIGVAVGNTGTRTATAVGTLPARGVPDWDAVTRCVRDWSPARLLVGLPYNMDGSESALTAACRRFAEELSRRYALPVELVDERLTSSAAQAPGATRGHRRQRGACDPRDLAAGSLPTHREHVLTTDTGRGQERDATG